MLDASVPFRCYSTFIVCLPKVWGRVEKHNVAIVFPETGAYGSDVIAHTVANMVRSFRNIQFGLMVGIGGGAPSMPDATDAWSDIRLGDVVVSEPKGLHSGVLQYDKGRWKKNGVFEIRSHQNKPPKILLSAMKLLQSDHDIGFGKMNDYYEDISEKSSRLRSWGFRFPGRHLDRLHKPTHPHTEGNRNDCSSCGTEELEQHLDRESDHPVVHYGLIASANAVMESANHRDHLRDTWGVRCFETEAAGLMNEFPCVVVRGIAHYSDGHKNDVWQRYAAAMAAAYAKDLLRVVQPEEGCGTEITSQLAGNLSQVLSKVDTNLTRLSDMMADAQREEILKWICPVDCRTDQSHFLAKRQPKTGQWLLSSDPFQYWYKGKGQTLLYRGIPNARKTVITATIIGYINAQQEQQEHADLALAFFFCHIHRQHQQRSIDLIASILKQLARQDRQLMQDFEALHARYKPTATQPSAREMANVLCARGKRQRRTYVAIDNLDEAQTSQKELMEFLAELFRIQDNTGLNLRVTSRSSPDVEKHFTDRK